MPTINGTSANDLLTGTPDDADAMFGLEGDDTLNGLGGDDSLFGGAGADVLNGGGDDQLSSVGGSATPWKRLV